jgi:hypothetical protein
MVILTSSVTMLTFDRFHNQLRIKGFDKISERIVHRILDWQSRNGNQLRHLRYQIFFSAAYFFHDQF